MLMGSNTNFNTNPLYDPLLIQNPSEKEASIWVWLGILIGAVIPGINMVVLITLTIGVYQRRGTKNFALAALLLYAIVFVFSFLFIAFCWFLAVASID